MNIETGWKVATGHGIAFRDGRHFFLLLFAVHYFRVDLRVFQHQLFVVLGPWEKKLLKSPRVEYYADLFVYIGGFQLKLGIFHVGFHPLRPGSLEGSSQLRWLRNFPCLSFTDWRKVYARALMFSKSYLTARNLMIRQHTLRLLAPCTDFSTVANASDYFTTLFFQLFFDDHWKTLWEASPSSSFWLLFECLGFPTDLSVGVRHRRAWIHADTKRERDKKKEQEALCSLSCSYLFHSPCRCERDFSFFPKRKDKTFAWKPETVKWVSFSSVKSRGCFGHWTAE